MEKQKNKNYKKALKYYEEGDINKALSFLEKSISENLKNSGALNLKALLLYIKGDLEEAITCFRINYEYNNDLIAKEYIIDVESDRERLALYNKAIKEINSLNIDEAIKLLNICRESDFNSIKVNTALGICYLKKGMYDESLVYTKKALKLNSKDSVAKKIMNDLQEYGDIDNKNPQYKKLAFMILIIISGSLVVGAKFINRHQTNEVLEDNNLGIVEIDEYDNYEKAIAINIEKLKGFIENRDFENINTFINENNNHMLKEESIYMEGINLLKEEGAEYFYNKGLEEYKKDELNKAKESFSIAHNYGKENYLYPHIVFFNGAVRDKLGDLDSIKYYEEYLGSNSKVEGYIEECTYRLALLYKDINMDKSREYARIIQDKYSNSIYYNDIIKGIL